MGKLSAQKTRRVNQGPRVDLPRRPIGLYSWVVTSDGHEHFSCLVCLTFFQVKVIQGRWSLSHVKGRMPLPTIVIIGPISHRFRDMANWNFPRKIAAKPLQMKTWLLLTAYKKSLAPYPMVPLPTNYNLLFSHNTARLAYHGALWPFKVIQGQWLACHLKASMRLPISDQFISVT